MFSKINESQKPLASYTNFAQYFSPDAMWKKIAAFSKKAGAKLIYGVLLLFNSASSPNVSLADKAKIYGAIGYFILPLDVIPDPTPIAGLSDDMAAIVWALKAIWDNITPEIHAKSREKLITWFPDVKDSDLKLF